MKTETWKKSFMVLGVLLLLIILGVILFFWGNSKTDWQEEMSTHGPFNISELGVTQNESKAYYNLKMGKEYKMDGTVEIAEGKATVIYMVDSEVIYEREMNSGVYQLDSIECVGTGTDVCIKIIATQDVVGSYNIKISARETRGEKMLRRLRENME